MADTIRPELTKAEVKVLIRGLTLAHMETKTMDEMDAVRDVEVRLQRAAACRRDHFDSWRVVQRNCNHSAFNGYHETPSDYSGLRCGTCGRYWRTRAGYVASVPDAE